MGKILGGYANFWSLVFFSKNQRAQPGSDPYEVKIFPIINLEIHFFGSYGGRKKNLKSGFSLKHLDQF